MKIICSSYLNFHLLNLVLEDVRNWFDLAIVRHLHKNFSICRLNVGENDDSEEKIRSRGGSGSLEQF